jgi:nucleolin
MCLQGHLQTSPPTPQKSYPKFQRSAKRTNPATPAPETAAKTGDSSDNCNSDKDENPAAKAALAKEAPAAAAKMEDRSSGEDISDEEETKPAAEESTAKPTDKGSDEDSVDSNDEKDAQKAKPAPKAAAKKEEPSPNEDISDEDEESTAKVADKKEANSSEDSSDEEVAVGEVSKPIKPHPEKHAAKPAAEAATTEESSDRDRPNSDEDPNPNKADQAERQPAMQPQDNQPPAKLHVSTAARKVSNVLAPETNHNSKENELNRKNRSQEENPMLEQCQSLRQPCFYLSFVKLLSLALEGLGLEISLSFKFKS